MSLNNLTPSQLALLDDPRWRRRNSKWRHIIWWSAGAYGVFALVFVAAKSKGKKAIMAAGVSVTLFVAFALVQAQIPVLSDSELAALEGTSRVATPLENVSSAIIMAMIAFNIWMSFFLQKDWLVWVVSKKNQGSWVEQNLNIKTIRTEPVVQQPSTPKTDLVNEQPFVDSSDYLKPNSTASHDSKSETNLEVVDLNNATKQDLLRIPGVDEPIASRILEARETRGHFRSFEDFSIALSLKPHEVKKFEGRFAFSTPNSGSPSGRILDV